MLNEPTVLEIVANAARGAEPGGAVRIGPVRARDIGELLQAALDRIGSSWPADGDTAIVCTGRIGDGAPGLQLDPLGVRDLAGRNARLEVGLMDQRAATRDAKDAANEFELLFSLVGARLDASEITRELALQPTTVRVAGKPAYRGQPRSDAWNLSLGRRRTGEAHVRLTELLAAVVPKTAAVKRVAQHQGLLPSVDIVVWNHTETLPTIIIEPNDWRSMSAMGCRFWIDIV